MKQPIKFCHIAPTQYVPLVKNHKRHLVLAHLVESDPEYVEAYLKIKQEDPTIEIIMDNSAFEQYKKGEPMFPSEKLIELGNRIGADYLVMSDYPKEHWEKTRDMAIEQANDFHNSRFKTFYVPQSQLGDIDGLLQSFKWAIHHPGLIDLIGVSILACPIGLGLDENTYDKASDGAHKLQRYTSRAHILRLIEQTILQERREEFFTLQGANINEYSMMEWWDEDKFAHEMFCHRFHMLGMVDGPNEIELVARWGGQVFDWIDSWDSSSAVWHGINGIQYDKSATGLKNGKFEKEVDFDTKFAAENLNQIMHNIGYIDRLVTNIANE